MQTAELEEKKCENANLKQVRFYCIVMFHREIHFFLQLTCSAFEDQIEFLSFGLFFFFSPEGQNMYFRYLKEKCSEISHAFLDFYKWITAFCFMCFVGTRNFKAECLQTGILNMVMHYLTGDSVAMETYKLFLGNALHLHCISHLRFFKCLTDVS